MSAHYPDDLEYGAEPSGNAIPAFVFDPWGVITRRWRWMLAALLLGLVATVAGVSRVQPRFAAEASVLITSQEIPQEFVRSTVRESSMTNMNATVSQVLSNDNLERLIDQFDLYEERRDKVSLEELAASMRNDIEITPESNIARGSRGQTSIVYRLSYESDAAWSAADVANAIAALVVEASIVQRNEQAQRVTRFLTNALAENERELREQSRKVSEFRRANLGQLPEELATNMKKLELMEERRTNLVTQIAEAEARILELSSRRTAAEQTENEALLVELRAQLTREEALNTKEHPNVKSLRRRVEAVEGLVEAEASGPGSLSSEAAVLIAAERREIARMREQIAEIDAKVPVLSERIDRTPGVAEELKALEQKEEVLREDYLTSLRKVEEAELAETLEMARQGAQVSILNRARPPTSPLRPRWMLLAAGIVLSFGVALGVAVLLELLDPVVVSANQLATIGEYPVLGSVPWVR